MLIFQGVCSDGEGNVRPSAKVASRRRVVSLVLLGIFRGTVQWDQLVVWRYTPKSLTDSPLKSFFHRKGSSSNHRFFRCKLLVSGREMIDIRSSASEGAIFWLKFFVSDIISWFSGLVKNDKVGQSFSTVIGKMMEKCWYPWNGGPFLSSTSYNYTLYQVGIYWVPIPF